MPNRSDRSIKPIRVTGNAAEWEVALAQIFVELEFVAAHEDQRLVGLMYLYPFGDLGFVRAITRGGRHNVLRSKRLIAKSQHNNFFIGCILAGRANLSQAGHHAVLERGDLAILDSSKEYSIEIPVGCDALWVMVPRYRIEGRMTSLEQIMSQRINGSAGIGLLASTLLRSSLQQATKIGPAEANRITNSLLDLIGMSLECNLASDPSISRGSLTTLRRIQNFVDANLDDENLSLERIATELSLSSRYVNKLFEREGVSTARWIRMRRLQKCRADLENPERRHLSIAEIAFSHGFGNISSFNRAFKTQFRVPPSAFRNSG